MLGAISSTEALAVLIYPLRLSLTVCPLCLTISE